MINYPPEQLPFSADICVSTFTASTNAKALMMFATRPFSM